MAVLQASEDKPSKQPDEATSVASRATLRAAQTDLTHLVRNFNGLRKIMMRSRGYENDGCFTLDSYKLCTHQSSIRSSYGSSQGVNMHCLSQREREARVTAELASLNERLASEETSWMARCDVLRQSLQKQEAHSAALEAQLASRPTALQVRTSF